MTACNCFYKINKVLKKIAFSKHLDSDFDLLIIILAGPFSRFFFSSIPFNRQNDVEIILALIFGKSQKTITENKIEKRPVSIFCLLGVVRFGGGGIF